MAGAARADAIAKGALDPPRYCTTTCTLAPPTPAGTIAETCPALTYTKLAAAPLKKTLTPLRTCGWSPAAASCKGPRLVPKITTISPGAMGPERLLAPLAMAVMVGRTPELGWMRRMALLPESDTKTRPALSTARPHGAFN